jgi:hypothetical protein
MASEAGAPRLMITHIVNQNFKSYAGEKVLGPFHKVLPAQITWNTSLITRYFSVLTVLTLYTHMLIDAQTVCCL